MDIEFINGEKFKILPIFSGDKERFEWSRIMHKYHRKCDLREFLEINLNSGQSKIIFQNNVKNQWLQSIIKNLSSLLNRLYGFGQISSIF